MTYDGGPATQFLCRRSRHDGFEFAFFFDSIR